MATLQHGSNPWLSLRGLADLTSLQTDDPKKYENFFFLFDTNQQWRRCGSFGGNAAILAISV